MIESTKIKGNWKVNWLNRLLPGRWRFTGSSRIEISPKSSSWNESAFLGGGSMREVSLGINEGGLNDSLRVRW